MTRCAILLPIALVLLICGCTPKEDGPMSQVPRLDVSSQEGYCSTGKGVPIGPPWLGLTTGGG